MSFHINSIFTSPQKCFAMGPSLLRPLEVEMDPHAPRVRAALVTPPVVAIDRPREEDPTATSSMKTNHTDTYIKQARITLFFSTALMRAENLAVPVACAPFTSSINGARPG